MKAKLHRFDSRKEMLQSLEQLLVASIKHGIQYDGVASLVLSGGNTPVPLYQALAKHDLEWSKVQIMPSDERWTTNKTDTNDFTIKQLFASRLQQGLQYYSMLSDDADIETSRQQVTRHLTRIKLPFDATIVGMGEDGHFASLFPESTGLADALNADHAQGCMVIQPATLPANAPYARISLTLSTLKRSRLLILLITGQSKLSLVKSITDTTDAMKFPVSMLLNLPDPTVAVYWSP